MSKIFYEQRELLNGMFEPVLLSIDDNIFYYDGEDDKNSIFSNLTDHIGEKLNVYSHLLEHEDLSKEMKILKVFVDDNGTWTIEGEWL